MAIRIAQGNGKGGLVLLVGLNDFSRGSQGRVPGTYGWPAYSGIPELRHGMFHISDTAGIISRGVGAVVRSGRFSHIGNIGIGKDFNTCSAFRISHHRCILTEVIPIPSPAGRVTESSSTCRRCVTALIPAVSTSQVMAHFMDVGSTVCRLLNPRN